MFSFVTQFRGLTRNTTTEMLHQYFSKFGDLIDCIVIKNPTTKLSRCFGFVQFQTSQIADEVVESRPHFIDGKEIDVKHASAERHQQQTALNHDRNRDSSPDRNKKRSRWENQNFTLPSDMNVVRSSSHIAFVQRDFVSYPIPLKYLRENSFNSPSTMENQFFNSQRHSFNNRNYQS